MSHQCVRCNTLYKDGSKEILKGCTCGSKLFFFLKNEDLANYQNSPKITRQEERLIEEDVKKIIGVEEIEEPVILDLENINVEHHGKFAIDIVKLFKGDPVVYKTGDGKYMIDLSATFSNFTKKNK